MTHHAPLARLVLQIGMLAINSATSASTAWVSSARAPPRSTPVRESVNTSGWASLMTLLSDSAYPSFIGEVEALKHHHDTPPYPVSPSPTSGHSPGRGAPRFRHNKDIIIGSMFDGGGQSLCFSAPGRVVPEIRRVQRPSATLTYDLLTTE
jgi:hypothetical protein